jgi:tetratricopeptide (TPR) repeat protein
MLRSYFVLIGGVLTGGFLIAALLATSASAGMSQDLSSCTAAKDRGAAAACTRVMNSGRLPQEQMYIGYFNRGTAQRSADDPDKAVADYSKVLQLKPGFARAYEARGMAYAELGDRAKAMSDLDEAIRRDASDWRFFYSRAVVLREEGDQEAALRDLEAAGAVKPDASFVPLMRAMIRAEQGAYDEARDDINRILSKGRDDAVAQYARAAVAFREGRMAAAEADVDSAIAKRGEFLSARVLKARIQDDRGERDAARAGYEKALNGPSDSFDGYHMRRFAKERLSKLGKRGDNVAEAKVENRRPLDCKVFLPATGSVVTAKCSE